ncbi:WecB/TagA/CpsF family glycosyltransferase [bacterium]|nr:WecB/TagA/CpsF family glycosyltransferase [bacterium]
MSSELFGFNIDTMSFNEAISDAKNLIDGHKVSQIVTINPEMFEYANKDLNFANIIKEAEMVIPDGVGVKIALQINGIKAERIPGVDFAKKLLEESAFNNIPVAIIGAKEEILTKAIENLQNEINGLNIVYYHNGYFKNNGEIYEELKKKSPKLILVAMGSPRQEEFIYNAKNVLNSGLMIGIGGSLDVWSNSIKRAPKIMQNLGLEWLYRTIIQPSRFKRIFPTLPMFIIKALNYKFSK